MIKGYINVIPVNSSALIILISILIIWTIIGILWNLNKKTKMKDIYGIIICITSPFFLYNYMRFTVNLGGTLVTIIGFALMFICLGIFFYKLGRENDKQ